MLHASRIVVAGLLFLNIATGVHAQDSADRTAIRNAALDYIEGWYTGDAARMERALHPELAKRIVRAGATGNQSILDQQSAMTLVQGTRAGYGKQVPEARRQKEVTILDVYGNAASVKIVASDWIDSSTWRAGTAPGESSTSFGS